MSELFTYKGDDEHYFIKTKNKHYAGYEVADLLNELSEENEQLKKQRYDLYMDIARLVKENEQLRVLLKEAEDEIENLKKSNKGLMESIVEKDEQINKLKKEVDEYKEAIINKVQYYEDIEGFAIKKGLIKKDWAKFDGYD